MQPSTMWTIQAPSALLSLALLAALARHGVRACSDMLLADPSVSPAVVGFRNLDFPPMAEARTWVWGAGLAD